MDEKTINAISALISNNKTVFIAFFIFCSICILRKNIREFFSRYSNSLFNLDSDIDNFIGLWNNSHDVKISDNKIEIFFEEGDSKYKYEAILNNLSGRGSYCKFTYLNIYLNAEKDYVKQDDIYLYLSSKKDEIQIYNCKTETVQILTK